MLATLTRFDSKIVSNIFEIRFQIWLKTRLKVWLEARLDIDSKFKSINNLDAPLS